MEPLQNAAVRPASNTFDPLIFTGSTPHPARPQPSTVGDSTGTTRSSKTPHFDVLNLPFRVFEDEDSSHENDHSHRSIVTTCHPTPHLRTPDMAVLGGGGGSGGGPELASSPPTKPSTFDGGAAEPLAAAARECRDPGDPGGSDQEVCVCV